MEELIKVWKLPQNINLDVVRQLTGNEGSRLNPIQDKHGNWIISQEEYDAEEFQFIKVEYADVVNSLILINYEPIPSTLP